METSEISFAEACLKEYKKCTSHFSQRRIINAARLTLSSEDFIIFLGDCIDFIQEIRNKAIVNIIIDINNKRNLILHKN